MKKFMIAAMLVCGMAGYAANLVSNGDFEIVKDGKPLNWEVDSLYLKHGVFDNAGQGTLLYWEVEKSNPAQVVKGKKGNAVQLAGNGQRLVQHLADPAVWQSPKPRRIAIKFTAWGKGQVSVATFRFTDKQVDGKNQRTQVALDRVKTFKVGENEQVFQTEYTIPADQWASLVFYGWDVCVDDVSVELLP